MSLLVQLLNNNNFYGNYRYVIERDLGKGRTSLVFLVRDLKDNQKKKVMKIMGQHDFDPERLNDMRVLKALKPDPHLIFIDDIFKHAVYLQSIVVEYCEGTTLAILIEQNIKENKTVSIRRAERWTKQLVSALSFMHSKSLIHKDVQPKNIFLNLQENIKLGHLNVRKESEKSLMSMQELYYSSPELVKREKYDHKTDVWSLACVCYELLTNKKAFEGKSLFELLNSILTKKPEPINDISDEFKRLFIEGLKRKAEDRLDTSALSEMFPLTPFDDGNMESEEKVWLDEMMRSEREKIERQKKEYEEARIKQEQEAENKRREQEQEIIKKEQALKKETDELKKGLSELKQEKTRMEKERRELEEKRLQEEIRLARQKEEEQSKREEFQKQQKVMKYLVKALETNETFRNETTRVYKLRNVSKRNHGIEFVSDTADESLHGQYLVFPYVGVSKGSKAHDAGMIEGQRLVAINDYLVTDQCENIQDVNTLFEEAIAERERVKLTVLDREKWDEFMEDPSQVIEHANYSQVLPTAAQLKTPSESSTSIKNQADQVIDSSNEEAAEKPEENLDLFKEPSFVRENTPQVKKNPKEKSRVCMIL